MSKTLEERLLALEEVHTSRRGPVGGNGERGPQGPQGFPGQSITGAPGRDGRDANIGECVAAAQTAMERELAAFRAALSGAIVQELKAAGVVDANGKAILVPGPAGKDSIVPGPPGERGETGAAGQSIKGDTGAPGADSTVPGPAGKNGESIVGPAGAPGKDAAPAKDGIDGKEVDTHALMAQLEARFRNVWKNDIQAALRGYFQEKN
jgi:hypothetical protein